VLKYRRLTVDPLEERQLLSLTVADYQDILVTESYSTSQQTLAGQSTAVDNDGDFVVVWTRQDTVNWGPNNSNTTLDLNVYARYFTDEVQRITLPDGVLTDNNPGTTGTITLRYPGIGRAHV
jgi:hypothetical protein